MRYLARFVLAVLVVLPSLDVEAADITPLRGGKDQRVIFGLKLEGEIKRGDTEKLLAALKSIGPDSGHLYLFSSGGNVAEAMKMGHAVRRLRISTHAPISAPKQGLRCIGFKPDDLENCHCVSACFLVYAAGVWRHGSHIGLHRPFLSKDEMARISDVDFEKSHKAVVIVVRDYLVGMDVPSKFIDVMMSHNSKRLYWINHEEADDDGLVGYVPAIEEIVLAKCSDLSERERSLFYSLARKKRAGTISSSEMRTFDKLAATSMKNIECGIDTVSDLHRDAFAREFR